MVGLGAHELEGDCWSEVGRLIRQRCLCVHGLCIKGLEGWRSGLRRLFRGRRLSC